MKKNVILLSILLSFILLISFVYAQTVNNSGTTGNSGVIASGSNVNTNTAIDNAYKCLKNEIDDRAGLSLEEAIFSALALGSYGNVSNAIDSWKSASDNCWPRSGCKLKETAQVALAYQSMGKSTDTIKTWLLSKSKNANALAWYLEIDTENQKASDCTVKYDGKSYNLNIDANQKITGSTGPCLSVSDSGYILRIRDSCMDRTFDTSCKEGFVTALIYQKDTGAGGDCLNQNGLTCFVLPETHSAASLGTTSEKVESTCFGSGDSCDFEGTLWATLALTKLNAKGNATKTLPYLSALAEDYGRYTPESFLLALTSNSDYYDTLIQNRKQAVYWETAGSPYNRFYDTSVAMLGIASSSSRAELQPTQDYLISIQTKEGCWNNNNIRDTAFILYGGWARGTIKGSGGSSSALCQEAGFSCERLTDCTNAGGNVLNNFECTSVGVCCSLKVSKPSCSSQNGKVCSLNQECNGLVKESSEGVCCLGTCTAITANTCELSTDAKCRTECQSGEVATSDECGGSGQICCVNIPSGGSSSWWIWLLAILIVLVILGIVFRKKLRLWIFALNNKIKSMPVSRGGDNKGSGAGASPAPRTGPGPRFGSPPRYIPVRKMLPIRPVSKPASSDKEMEETLRKLREISGK